MTPNAYEKQLICQCLVDLSNSDKDIATSCEKFFAREAPHLGQFDRMRILRFVYEIAGARMEKLKDEAISYLKKDPKRRNPALSLDAQHRHDLSRQYYEIFKPLGYYLIELQRQTPLPASRH